MIERMGTNDVVEATNLMSDTWYSDEYFGYSRNEVVWVQHLIKHITEETNGNPNFVAVKDVDERGNMKGFLIASTYHNYYDNEVVMDVKDCIVDYTSGKLANAKTVKALFDAMIEHTKKHGGKHWRADSIHSGPENEAYSNFLQRHYNCSVRYSTRGVIE